MRAVWLLAVVLPFAGCSALARRRASTPRVSPAQVAIRTASEAFARGRQAALTGDPLCARYAFSEALQAVRPIGTLPPSDPELIVFSLELYESILRYEALSAPPEEAPIANGIAQELKKIEAPAATEEAISTAREAVESDSAGVDYDIPIVINEPVLKILATFQTDLHDVIARGLGRSGRYVPMIHRVFEEQGLPKDLAQVALIESSFLPRARSPKSAHGIWQFMPRTGRQYGLMNNAVIDERSDPEKATRAAARYLSYLYELFHDWYLALAAYNTGEGRVLRAMERTGLTDFWQLAAAGALHPETRHYVPAVIAATLISKNPVHYGFDVEYEKPLEYETVRLDRPVHIKHLVDEEQVPLDELRLLNPELSTEITPRQPEGYDLKVPVGTRENVLFAFAAAPTARPPAFRRHRVRRGDTLASVARRYGVPVKTLASANSLSRRARLKRGRVLVIPEREGIRVASRRARKRGSTETGVTLAGARASSPKKYRVRGGDTLYRIAMRHGTTVSRILAANSLEDGSRIRPGETLRIPPKSR